MVRNITAYILALLFTSHIGNHLQNASRIINLQKLAVNTTSGIYDNLQEKVVLKLSTMLQVHFNVDQPDPDITQGKNLHLQTSNESMKSTTTARSGIIFDFQG